MERVCQYLMRLVKSQSKMYQNLVNQLLVRERFKICIRRFPQLRSLLLEDASQSTSLNTTRDSYYFKGAGKPLRLDDAQSNVVARYLATTESTQPSRRRVLAIKSSLDQALISWPAVYFDKGRDRIDTWVNFSKSGRENKRDGTYMLVRPPSCRILSSTNSFDH